jgi:hypothetical protein
MFFKKLKTYKSFSVDVALSPVVIIIYISKLNEQMVIEGYAEVMDILPSEFNLYVWNA